METNGKPTRTRVFRAGNSQAVRIPKPLELPEGEVYIERREGGLFISALRGRWDLFFAKPGVDFPFTAEDLRHRGPHREVDLNPGAARTRPLTRKGATRAARRSKPRRP
jgi:virulence-associated protein VagC